VGQKPPVRAAHRIPPGSPPIAGFSSVANVQFNLADLFEAVAAEVPEREALVLGAHGTAHRRLRFDELDARANRLAPWSIGRRSAANPT